MNVDIDETTYIPSTDHPLFFSIFKKMKLSFIALLIIIIFVYIIIFFVVGNAKRNPTDSSFNVIVILLEIFLWSLLLYVVYINLKYTNDKNYNFQAEVSNLFNTKLADLSINAERNHYLNGRNGEYDETTADTTEHTTQEPTQTKTTKKEVFHIANNKYNYAQAKKICEKYNSELATYDEIEDAYNNGANWCSYGWSKDQLALFPTQKEKYNQLKHIPGHEHDCGRPGINGGHFSNKYIKFGVNCYGKKPKPKHSDKHYMHSVNHTPTIDKLIKNKKKKNIYKNYVVAPFNNDKWSQKK